MSIGEIDILLPEATKNYILNPSPENDLSNWVPAWNQEATLEDQETIPNPTGFDSVNGGVSVTGQAAIRGDWGLQSDIIVAPPGVNTAFGTFSDPDGETEIVAEMYFNTNNIAAVGAGEFYRIMQTTGTLETTLSIDDVAGVLRLSCIYNEDGPAPTTMTVQNLELGTTYKLRAHVKYATAPAANDGFVRIYIDDVLVVEATGLDSDTGDVDSIRYGNVGSNNFSGTLYSDNCRWADSDVPFTGCSIERTLERARFGRYSTRVYTDGFTVNEGIYARVSDTNLSGMVTASAYVRGDGEVRIRIKDGLSGNQFYSAPVAIHDRYWQRIEVQGTAYGSDDLRVYIETAGLAQEATFYVDGVQLEQKPYMTSYVDGTQPGCRWNGVSYKSTSERDATEMNGGVWTSLREDECDPDTYFTNMFGFGMPPVTINRQRMALASGSFYDSSKVEERPFGITVTVKDRDAQNRTGAEIKKIWALRQRLEDIFKPDSNPNNEPFWLRYRQDDKFLMIRALYEAGLEFDGDVRNKFFNQVPLRFLALDPFWYEDSQEVAVISTEKPLDDIYLMAHRVDGAWQELAQDLADTGGLERVRDYEEDANGIIYVGGNFTQDGEGNNLRNFAVLNDDYTVLSEVATGFNDVVRAIAAHPNGLIYIVGEFTADNDGNAFNYIASYDPSTDSFSALGAGLDDDAYNLSIAPNGDVYVTGLFTQAGGNNANYIARWDGSSWHAVGDINADLGAEDLASYGYDILIRNDDEVYICGAWQLDGTVYRALAYDGTTWTDLGTSSAIGGAALKMFFDNDGTIIIGSRGEVNRWNGSAYTAIASGGDFLKDDGNDGAFYDIDLGPDGFIYVVGDFASYLGERIARNIALWNGSSWVTFDLDIKNVATAIMVRENNDVYLGLWDALVPSVDTDAVASGKTTVECVSTTGTFVIVSFTGTGRVIWLENQGAQVTSYFNYDLQAAETLEVDFREGIKTVRSNYAGDVPDAILANSEDVFLLAGTLEEASENLIACLIIDEVEPTAQIRYIPTHWSIDAISIL